MDDDEHPEDSADPRRGDGRRSSGSPPGRGQGRDQGGQSAGRGSRRQGQPGRSKAQQGRRGQGGRKQQGRGREDGPEGRKQPPPRPRSSRRPPRPDLPQSPGRLRRDVRADLRATAPPGTQEDLERAVSGAADALESGDTTRALELLTWAKAVAPRSGALREALGVAAYLAGDFEQAHRELLAYRRMTERHDQNHLLADSARAIGRHDKIGEYVREMAATPKIPEDRLVEAYLVQAGAWADRGDLRGALGVLERLDLDPDEVRPWHPRVWYLAADVCERMGDRSRARDYFEAITAVTEDFLDVEERLAELS